MPQSIRESRRSYQTQKKRSQLSVDGAFRSLISAILLRTLEDIGTQHEYDARRFIGSPLFTEMCDVAEIDREAYMKAIGRKGGKE